MKTKKTDKKKKNKPAGSIALVNDLDLARIESLLSIRARATASRPLNFGLDTEIGRHFSSQKMRPPARAGLGRLLRDLQTEGRVLQAAPPPARQLLLLVCVCVFFQMDTRLSPFEWQASRRGFLARTRVGLTRAQARTRARARARAPANCIPKAAGSQADLAARNTNDANDKSNNNDDNKLA